MASYYKAIDDGHRPGETDVPTQLLFQKKTPSHFLIINDNLLSETWLNRSYEYAKDLNKPWGTYISTSEVLDETIDTELLWKTNPQKAIALIATKALLFDKSKKLLPFDDIVSQVDGRLNFIVMISSTSSIFPYSSSSHLSILSVTAVWCLSSGFTNEVEYHIDYAELYRYQHTYNLPD